MLSLAGTKSLRLLLVAGQLAQARCEQATVARGITLTGGSQGFAFTKKRRRMGSPLAPERSGSPGPREEVVEVASKYRRLRTALAAAAGRAVKATIRLVNPDRGSNLPGRVALAVDPEALRILSGKLAHPIVLVSGTNGKTTTAALTTEILSVVAGKVTTNKAGANLEAGLASALLDATSGPACFEVDEGALPDVLSECHPDVILLLNLSRDQLDRYGEIDTVASRWVEALAGKGPELTVLANADDPRVAHVALEVAGGRAAGSGPTTDLAGVAAAGSDLGEGDPRRAGPRVAFFGVEAHPTDETAHLPAPDALACPFCRSELSYAMAFSTGGGHYHCPACGFSRPHPTYRVNDYVALGLSGSRVSVETPSGALKATFPLPGLHNVYDALAAAAAAVEAGISTEAIAEALCRSTAAYGRCETVELDGKRAFLLLSKNPQSLSQNLRLVRHEAEAYLNSPSAASREFGAEKARKSGALLGTQSPAGPVLPVVFALNDLTADGRDVSWIWDVDFAGSLNLASGEIPPARFAVVACGERAESAALRLAYDGWDRSLLTTVRDPYHALAMAMAEAPVRWAVPVLATYTAMRTLRGDLVRRGFAPPIEEARN